MQRREIKFRGMINGKGIYYSTKDVFEKDLGFIRNVRQRYLELASRPPRNQQRWEIVDASQPISRIQDTIVDIVMGLVSPIGL